VSRLPWVRLDTGIMHDPKLVELHARGQHRAALLYVYGLAWSGGYGTDGVIPKSALRSLEGRPADARELVAAGLWDERDGSSWLIHAFADYQAGSSYRDANKRNVCARWMRAGKPCSCGTHTDIRIVDTTALRAVNERNGT
jgi:hypothetical protein